jgi:ATP-dependent RNA helicase RhlE
MLFEEFEINPLILKAIEDEGYKKMTPIQEKAIPSLLEGKDMLGCAATGTGKTAAFAIPILHRLSEVPLSTEVYNPIRALVLAPTRELAIQIGESFETYGKTIDHHTGVVYGGITPKRHIKVLKREPSILIATPGRLLDLHEQGYADLSHIEMLVIDEADRMLDLGMIKDVKHILSKLPKKRQNMLFSATMPTEVMKLVHAILKNPVKIEIHSKPSSKPKIQQKAYIIDEPDKTALLLELLKKEPIESALIFTRTKKKADKVAKAINVENIRAKAIHGDKSQSERIKALDLFKNKEIKVLVATDVAARGIDIDQLSHVINMDIPAVPENYIHRIGRTGRAGKGGIAISFCSPQEIPSFKEIEKLQKSTIEVIKHHNYPVMNLVISQNREDHAQKPKKKVESKATSKNHQKVNPKSKNRK